MKDDCKRWGELSDLRAVEGELSIGEAEFIVAHVKSCASCAAERLVFEQLSGCLDQTEQEAGQAPHGDRTVPITHELRHARPAARRNWIVAFSTVAAAVAAAAAWAFSLGAGSANPTVGPPPPAMAGVPRARSFAQLLLVSGDVTMEGSQPSAGATLDEADTMVVGEGRACLAHGDVTTCVESHSRVRILEARGATRRVELGRGTLLSRQAPGTSRDEFEVKTKFGTVTGIGARFVTAYVDGGVSISSLGGRLRIVPSSGVEKVIEGRQSVRFDASSVVPEEPQNGPTESLFSEMASWEEASLTPVALTSTPSGATVRIDDASVGVTPLSMMMPRGSHDLVVELPGFAEHEGSLDVQGAERVAQEVTLVRLEPETKPATATPAGPAQLLSQAQALRKQGKYADAAWAYQALLSRYPSSSEAAASRLSLAELQLTGLGAPAPALASFRQYLRSGGALRQEARYGEIRALRALGRDAEARGLAEKFVRTYPDSGQAVSLGRWLGTSSPSAE